MAGGPGADIAGAAFGGVAATAVIVKATHWLYTYWQTRPTKLARILDRIAAQKANEAEREIALNELVKLEQPTRNKMLDGTVARCTENRDVEAVLALGIFRTAVDEKAEREQRSAATVTPRSDPEAVQDRQTWETNIVSGFKNMDKNKNDPLDVTDEFASGTIQKPDEDDPWGSAQFNISKKTKKGKKGAGRQHNGTNISWSAPSTAYEMPDFKELQPRHGG
jgi:hypothetical protein